MMIFRVGCPLTCSFQKPFHRGSQIVQDLSYLGKSGLYQQLLPSCHVRLSCSGVEHAKTSSGWDWRCSSIGRHVWCGWSHSPWQGGRQRFSMINNLRESTDKAQGLYASGNLRKTAQAGNHRSSRSEAPFTFPAACSLEYLFVTQCKSLVATNVPSPCRHPQGPGSFSNARLTERHPPFPILPPLLSAVHRLCAYLGLQGLKQMATLHQFAARPLLQVALEFLACSDRPLHWQPSAVSPAPLQGLYLPGVHQSLIQEPSLANPP